MSHGEITALLGRIRDGQPAARDELLPLVYRELEDIARGYVRRDASIEPAGLVHELYLRMAVADIDARDRKHFYAMAALAMRQILVDRARRKRASKRGGDAVQVTLSGLSAEPSPADLVDLDQALARLEVRSSRQARIVELRCLMGLSIAEIAAVLDVSERTVHADWRLARAWLTVELSRT